MAVKHRGDSDVIAGKDGKRQVFRRLSPAGMSGVAFGVMAGGALGGPAGALVGAVLGGAAGEALEHAVPSKSRGQARAN